MSPPVVRLNPFKPHYDKCNAGNSRQKQDSLPAFPRMIDIEMTNTCNFRCLMCPTGNFSQTRAKGFMSEEVFHKILEEIRPHGTPLRFIGWGEPLSHPKVLEFLRAAHEAGIICHVNTNGSKLSDEMMEELLAIPLDSIKFSFQGVDRKSYGEMRNIDFFDELVDTISRLHTKRGERAKPYMHVSTTITYESRETVRSFKERVAPLVDLVNVGRTVLEFVDVNAVRLRPHELEELNRLKEMEDTSLMRHPTPCPEVYDKLTVQWDGGMRVCCNDYDGVTDLGNINDTSLDAAWRRPVIEAYRGRLANGEYTGPLCSACWSYMEGAT